MTRLQKVKFQDQDSELSFDKELLPVDCSASGPRLKQEIITDTVLLIRQLSQMIDQL